MQPKLGRWKSAKVAPFLTAINNTLTYSYDDAGNVASKTVVAATGTTTWSYGYDNANDLTSAVEKTGTTTLQSVTYAYDAFGNVVQAGKKHFAKLCEVLSNVPPSTTVFLDFKHVEIVTGSWVNAVFAPFFQWAGNEQTDLFPVICNLAVKEWGSTRPRCQWRCLLRPQCHRRGGPRHGHLQQLAVKRAAYRRKRARRRAGLFGETKRYAVSFHASYRPRTTSRSISTIVNPLPRAVVEDAPFRFGISSMGVHRSFLTGSGTATPPPTTPGRMCSHHADEVPERNPKRENSLFCEYRKSWNHNHFRDSESLSVVFKSKRSAESFPALPPRTKGMHE